MEDAQFQELMDILKNIRWGISWIAMLLTQQFLNQDGPPPEEEKVEAKVDGEPS